MKSAAVLFLLSCFCPLVRADLLVTVDTLCQATPFGSSIPVYAESHSAVFPNGVLQANFACNTPYGSFTFGASADQITNGLQMQAGVGLVNTPPTPLYALSGSIDLRASMPQQVLVALGGTGTAFLQGISDCGGDAGFTGTIKISAVYINDGSFETNCSQGGPGMIRYPIVFGEPFTMGWQGEIAFQLFSSPGGSADGGFYLFDSFAPGTPFLVDQNGNPIPGASLVAVPEPKSILLVGAFLVFAVLRILCKSARTLRVKSAVTYALVVATSIGAFGQTSYTAAAIGPGQHVFGAGINNSGQVTGRGIFLAPDFVTHAFLFSNGVITDLPGRFQPYSAGFAINDSGQITGFASLSDSVGPFHAFLYSNGSMTDIGGLPGSGGSIGTAINSSGQIAGASSFTQVTNQHAFLYSNGTMTDLGTLPGGNTSFASGINNSGEITGASGVLTGGSMGVVTSTMHAFVYANGVMSDIGTLPGGSNSAGTAINNSGQVAGYSDLSGGATHAFAYTDGAMTDLGTLDGSSGQFSVALGINDSGQIVGYSTIPGGGPAHAFLYSSGVMSDLNSLVTSALPTGFVFTSATGINNSGQIVANGFTIPGLVDQAFLLSAASASLAP